MSNVYEGMVQMKPNFKNMEFFSGDDDFTYQMPRVYFECFGEINDSHSEFNWSDNSLITFKDNCAVKYTEVISCELLLPVENGEEFWFDAREDLGEVALEYAKEIRPVKSYIIEEYDWNKSEKRRYKVVLEETSKLEDYEQRYLKKVISRDSEDAGKEYMLAQS